MLKFSSIGKENVGEIATALARVESIHQTSGPTLFTLFDGASDFVFKAFLRPGSKAYPEISEKDVVQVVFRVEEYGGRIEGQISAMEKRDNSLFDAQSKEFQKEKLNVNPIPFLIGSKWLEKLRPRFEKAAGIIRQAIYDGRPIILRHNADCDGYSGAVAMERAILPLLSGKYTDSFSQWKYYKRLPSRAPFYETSDVFFDIVGITNDLMKGLPAPLVIILDNGSGEEDEFGIKFLKSYGCPVIVVDHHFAAKDVISGRVDVHINPYLAGYNSQICAGMLGTELARFVNNDAGGIAHLPALAGAADKVEGNEFESYLALLKKDDIDLPYLKKWAVAVDFAAYYLKGMEGRHFVDSLLSGSKSGKELVDLLHGEAASKISSALNAAKHYIEIIEKTDKVFAKLDLNAVSSKGGFPSFGKLSGAVSDWLNDKYKVPVYLIGIGNEMVVFRVSKKAVFSLHDVIRELIKEKPHAGVAGGGHERAGTIKFAPAAREEVVGFIEKFILDKV